MQNIEKQRGSLKPHARVSDDFGNTIIRNGNRMLLKLRGEDDIRILGVIDFRTRVLHTVRNKNIHLHKKTNSYGFNNYLIEKATMFDKVAIRIGKDTFVIPNEDIMKYGQYLFFKEQGFELQIFVPVEILNRYRNGIEKPR